MIINPPTNESVVAGGAVTFNVTVSDAGPVTYLWQLNGSNVPNHIMTLAGNGTTNSLLGDNGPATNATLYNPSGVCVDSSGNVYIADHLNQRVRKVSTNGFITTVAGRGLPAFAGDGGPATNSSLSGPTRLAMDALGRLYIADTGNERVRRIDTNNIISTIAGNGTAGYSSDNIAATSAELDYPQGLAFDGFGDLYIADTLNQRIRQVGGNGVITTVAGNGTAGYRSDPLYNDSIFELNNPYGVAWGPFGLYIADLFTNMVRTPTNTGALVPVAGVGTNGFSGDGGPATLAELFQPSDVAFDSSFNCYIADSANNRIRQVTSNGVIFTVAGNGVAAFAGDGALATNASLNQPASVCVDAAGNIYIADQQNNRIRKVSAFASGPALTLKGVSTAEAGSYTVIVSDSSGSVASSVAVLTVNTLPAITLQPVNQSIILGSNASFSASATGTPPLVYQWLYNGAPVPQNGSSNILFLHNPTNSGDYSLVVTNSYGSVTSTVVTLIVGVPPSITAQVAEQVVWPLSNAFLNVGVAGTGPFSYQWQFNGTNLPDDIIESMAAGSLNDPGGVAVDPVGNVYIADTRNYRVQKVSLNGGVSVFAGGHQNADSGDGLPANSASLTEPFSVALDPVGNLYIGEASRVRKVNTNGIITTAAGTGTMGFAGDSGPANQAEIDYAIAVACDFAGNLYIADLFNNRVRKVDGNGIITTIAGNGTAGHQGDSGNAISAELNQPAGVAIDTSGNLYIADSSNNCIRKVTASGIITTIAGTGVAGFGGDGGPAAKALLHFPGPLAFDASGDLLFTDASNDRIRQITPSGIITTVAGSGAGFAGDGLAATNAELLGPSEIALDSMGNLYIADSSNNRIREVFSAGPTELLFSNVTSANVGNYSVAISSPFGSVTSGVFSMLLVMRPVLGSMIVKADGTVALNFNGAPAASHRLWSAANLSSPVAWSPIATNSTDIHGVGQLIDTNLPASPAQFYRVSLP